MSRRYQESVTVTLSVVDAPDTFTWSGKLSRVKEVLATWHLQDRWWEARGDRRSNRYYRRLEVQDHMVIELYREASRRIGWLLPRSESIAYQAAQRRNTGQRQSGQGDKQGRKEEGEVEIAPLAGKAETMGVPQLQYHRVTLAAFPGVDLPAAFEIAGQRLYFPVATVCAALELDVRSQRARLQRDYLEHIARFHLPTAGGGVQELLCVEYEALALWLATVQDGKAGGRSRERIRAFRAQVMAAASDVLMGRLQPVPIEARREQARSGRPGLGSLLLQAEGRIAELERVVFVGEPAADRAGDQDTDTTLTTARCPHCGRTLKVTVGTIEAIPDTPAADDDED